MNTINLIMSLIDILNVSFTVYFIDKLFNKYFNGRLPHSMILFITLINANVIYLTVYDYLKAPPSILLGVILSYWPLFVLYNGKLYQKAFIHSFIASFTSLCELILFISSSFSIPDEDTILTYLFIKSFGVLFIFIPCKICVIFFNAVRKYSRGYHIMLICYFSGQYMLYLFLTIHFVAAEYLTSLIIIFSYGVLSALTLLFMHYNRLSFQAEQKKKQLEYENKILSDMAAEIQKENDKNIKLRHDIGNHIAAIKTLIETGNSSIAEEYYQYVKNEISDLSSGK